jgi:hypothetical protein
MLSSTKLRPQFLDGLKFCAERTVDCVTGNISYVLVITPYRFIQLRFAGQEPTGDARMQI